MQGTTSKDGPGVVAGLENLAPEELFREGSQYFKAKDYARARAYLERYVELAPSDAHACHLLARVYYHENDNLDKAADCLERAVQLDPAGACRFYQTMAEIYIHLGEYGTAEEVLSLAAAQDPGDDPKLTYAIDFYLNLVKKKSKGGPRAAKPGKGRAGYYSAKEDDRYNRKGRHLFLLPSMIVHVIVLIFMAQLSGMSLHPREESAVEYAYIDVGVIGGETGGGETGEAAAPGGTEGSAQSHDAERAPAEIGAPGRRSAQAGIEETPEYGPGGRSALPAEKAAAGLEAGTSTDAAAAPGSTGKRLDMAERALEMRGGEVNFRPGELGLDPGDAVSSERAEARAGVLSERRDTPSASARGVAGAETGRAERPSEALGRKAGASLKADSLTVRVPAPLDAGEKSVELDRPVKAVPEQLFADADMVRSTPGKLGLGTSGGKGETGEVPLPDETIGTVVRGEAKAAPKAFDAGTGPEASGPAFSSARGKMSVPSGPSPGEADAPEPAARTERTGRIDTARPVREISGAGQPHAAGDLGISVGKTAGREGQRGAARPGAPKGITERQAAAALAGAGGQEGAGTELGGPARGYSAAGSGKGVSAGALSGGSSEVSSAGIRTGGEKGSAITGRRGPSGTASVPGAAPRGAAGLEGLVRETSPGRGAGGGATGGGGAGAKPGVRLGSGEKTGTAAPPGSGLAGAPGAGQRDGVASSGKRDAEGALGVPGGKGQERYAALAKARSGPIAPEKRPGVSLASKSGPKGLFGLSVKILTPAPGNSRELTQVVTGMVSDPGVTKATLTVNSDSRVVSVSEGRFEAAVALADGKNVITAMAFDKDGNAGKDTVTVNYRAARGSVPISIAEPRDGQVFDVSRGNIIKVRGTIGDPKIKRATLILNGRPKEITVKDGRFSQETALTQEKNTVMVEAEDDEGGFSTSGTVSFTTMNVTPKDIMIILTWDKPNADFDLHVHGPMGGHASYKSPNIYESKEAIAGAQIEQDAKGNFGPEVFTMEKAEKGVYAIKSNYFYSGGDGDAHATVTVILYGDNPARRIVRVFGPHLQADTKTGEEMWDAARFRMPEGIFLED